MNRANLEASTPRNSPSWDVTPVHSILTITIPPELDLFDSILVAARAAGLERGTVVSGIGAIGQSRVRNVARFLQQFPVQVGDLNYFANACPLELLSVTGWRAPEEDQELYLHAHISASTVVNDSVLVLGGHLGSGLVTTWIMVVV